MSDGIAILLAYVAHRISKKDSNERKTFGYKRIEILAAFINSVFLVAICIFLIYQAIERFRHPESMNGMIMLLVAGIGLVVNLIAVIFLKNWILKVLKEILNHFPKFLIFIISTSGI